MEQELREEGRVPGEVVIVYRQPQPREVVEQYTRPLPARMIPKKEPKKRRKRLGLIIFLICLAVGILAQLIDGTLGMAYGVSCSTFLRTFIPDFLAHMKARGDDKRCIFHISDEPSPKPSRQNSMWERASIVM